MTPTPRAAPEPRLEDRLERGGWPVELLRVPAALFGVVSSARAALYDRGVLPSVRVDTPVVSVGNLTAGGSGKTPMTAWLVREFEARGLRAGVLSRGYGAEAGERNDEARMLAELAPRAEFVQDRDRVKGALELGSRGVDVIVLDDGFQHRRLARDLDLVLVDATRPWGLAGRDARNAPMLPRGLLRERPSALARAHAIVLTRVDQARASDLSELRAQIERFAPLAPICCAVHRPAKLRSLDGGARELESLRGERVEALSALASPQAFERTLADLGAEVVASRRFPDHHRYVEADLDGLGADGRTVLTTAKDAPKLRDVLRGDARSKQIWVLDVEFEIVDGAPPLRALLESLPSSRAARERAALHEGLHG